MIVFNLFDSAKFLLASYTDERLCKEFLVQESVEAARVAWVGVFRANETARAIPMWQPYDFVDNFPHS